MCAVAFSPDGETLASGSGDNTVRLLGPVVRKEEWERRERKAREEQERQRQAWRAAGRCVECGAKLGFLDKLGGHTHCTRHR